MRIKYSVKTLDEIIRYWIEATHINNLIDMIDEDADEVGEAYEFAEWMDGDPSGNSIMGVVDCLEVASTKAATVEELECMELGWVIGKKYWGNGYMPEAATKILNVLFDEVGANCVYAGYDVNNSKSGRVMQKIGMKYEGILHQFGKNNQGIVDCARYSMIKADR